MNVFGWPITFRFFFVALFDWSISPHHVVQVTHRKWLVDYLQYNNLLFFFLLYGYYLQVVNDFSGQNVIAFAMTYDKIFDDRQKVYMLKYST